MNYHNQRLRFLSSWDPFWLIQKEVTLHFLLQVWIFLRIHVRSLILLTYIIMINMLPVVRQSCDTDR